MSPWRLRCSGRNFGSSAHCRKAQSTFGKSFADPTDWTLLYTLRGHTYAELPQLGWDWRSSDRNLAPKSSQFSLTRPTNDRIVTCGPCVPLIERPPPRRRRDVSLRQFCRGRPRPIGDACRHLGQNRGLPCSGSAEHGDLALSLRDFWRQCCWRQRQGSSWLRGAAGFPTLSSAGGTSRAWRKETCER